MDSNTHLSFSYLFNFSPVPGSKLLFCFFFPSPPLPLPLCAQSPCSLEVSFFLSSTPWLTIYFFEENTLSRIQWERKSIPVSVPSSFLSLPISKQKLFMESTHHVLWEKRKPSAPFTLLEAEECQAPVQQCIESSFFPSFSVYWAQRLQCLYVNMDSQHLPTCLSTFSCLKKFKN